MAPRVTALVDEPRGRVRVELDGVPWRVVPGAAVVGAGLRVGGELDRQRARMLRHELRRAEALAIATGALARRDYSTADLDARLERRGVAPGERARAIATLERAGYLDDDRLAAGRTAELAARGYGDEWIRLDLERHGVGREVIEGMLATLPAESERAAEQAVRAGRGPSVARRLAAKGFTAESIESVLEAHGDPP